MVPKYVRKNKMTIKTELLKRYLADHISNSISDFEIDENKIASEKAIEILSQIQEIIKNDGYSDFDKVEKIICLFEKNYIDTDCCHDF